MRTEVKICGITRREDAEFAIECGADYLGFVLVPQSKRYVSPEKLRQFADLPVTKVGVFMNAGLDLIRRLTEEGDLDIVQLHGSEPAEFASQIGFARVWKASYDADFPAERLVCDAPQGGSGTFGDHRRAAELAKLRPIMLAGGITPENAAALIRKVRPAGIDLAGGTESSPGIKDHDKIRKLFDNLKGMEE